MATASVLSAPGIPANFAYIEWQDSFAKEKPVQVVDAHNMNPDQKAATITFHDDNVEEVHDVRGHESEFSIDVQGFEYIKHTSEISADQFKDKAFVDAHYLPECEKLLKARFEGVDRIHFLHWRVCSQKSNAQSHTMLIRPNKDSKNRKQRPHLPNRTSQVRSRR